MGGGGGGDQTTTSNPWSGQAPYLSDVFDQSRQLYYSGGPDYYGGNSVAPFSPQTQQAFDMTTQRAMNGAPYEQAMSNYTTTAMGQGTPDMNQALGGAGQLMGGIDPGQQLLAQGAQNPYADIWGAQNFMGSGLDPYQGALANTLDPSQQLASGEFAPYSQALQGSLGYGGLSDAQQFAGSPAAGSLGASNQYVQDVLSQSPSLSQSINSVSGAIDPAVQQQLAGTAQGNFLGSNPYLDDAFNNAASNVTQQFNETVMPGIAAQFGSAGRTGGGIHSQTVGNAAGQLGDSLSQLASDIYAPAYESERNRQIDAAGTLGQLGMGTAGLGADLYGGEQQRRLGAAGLGGDLYSAQNQADMSRLGLASNLYLGERGLGQDAMGMGMDSTLGLYGLSQQGALGGMGMMLDQNQAANSAYQQGLGNMMMGGGQMMDFGLGGMGFMNDYYQNADRSAATAAALAPQLQAMDYNNIDRLSNVGAQIEDQAQRLIDADMARYNFYQQAPYQNLAQYSNLINQMPGGYGTTTAPSQQGSRTAGVLGGAMSGAQMGAMTGNPYGAVIGGLLGAAGGYYM